MPPTTRLPIVEFRSLLLPPIRIRLRTINSFSRSQCPLVALHSTRPATPCFVQRRSLHLYKTAKAKTALGMQKILAFNIYDVPPLSASDHRVNIVKSEFDQTPIAKDISLQEVYDRHIEPGKILYMTRPISKKLAENYQKLGDENIPSQNNTYAIIPAHTIEVNLKNPQKEGKQLGPLKGVHITLANPIAYTKEALDRAYQFIDLGSPVEFRVRLLGSVMKKNGKALPPDPDAWPWMHAHFPHLRPDFILKSMPQGTDYLIRPLSDGWTVQFVLGRKAKQMPKLSLTKRVFRVKAAVTQSMGKHSAAQRWAVKKEDRRPDDGDNEGKALPAKEKKKPSVDEEKAMERRRMEKIFGVDAWDSEPKNGVQADNAKQAGEEERDRRQAVGKHKTAKEAMQPRRKP